MKVKDCFYVNPTGNSNKYKDYINYIDTSSVTDGVLSNVSYLEDDFPSRAQRLIRQEDILYSSVRPNLRHYYYYNDSYEHAVASSGFVLLRKKKDCNINSKFVYYYLMTSEIVDYLSGIAELSQSTFPSFSPKDMEKIELPDIKREKQDVIAGILSEYDNLIRLNNGKIANLQRILFSRFLELFVRTKDRDAEAQNKINEIPDGWRETRIEEFCESAVRGITPSYCDEGIRVINQKCIRNNSVDLALCRQTKDNSRIKAEKQIEYGDILINSTGTGTLGRTAIYRYNDGLITADGHVTVFKVNDKRLSAFVGFILHSIEPILENLGRGSTNQLELSAKDIKRIKIVVPNNMEKAYAFQSEADDFFSEINSIEEENRILAEQRNMIMPRLLREKIKVL